MLQAKVTARWVRGDKTARRKRLLTIIIYLVSYKTAHTL